MIVRIYDADGKDKANASRSIRRMFIRGNKLKLWKLIGKAEVEHYEFVWFMDDDLLFSKQFFPFDQFLYVVKNLIL